MVAARVYIVRHGETNENRLGIMQGQLDTELNDAGVEQAQLTAGALEKVPFTKAFSSDLKRAVKTAETILTKHPRVDLERHPELRERNLGDWQGRKLEGRGSSAPANAEPLLEFLARALRWWDDRIVSCAAHSSGEEPEHILVVSHGGLISRLIATLVDGDKVSWATGGTRVTTKCYNASISVVELETHGSGSLITYSDTTHLRVDFVENNADL